MDKKRSRCTSSVKFSNFPQGKIYKGYKNTLFKNDNYKSIKVTRLWTFIYPNKGNYILRVIDFLTFSLSSFLYLLFNKEKFDIVVATSPQFFSPLSIFLFKS